MALQLWDQKLLLPDGVGVPKPLANHEDCCCPEDNCPYCKFATKPTEWKADLGAGGWVDSVTCDFCDQVAGEYTLDLTDPASSCIWQYYAEGVCGAMSSVVVTLKTRWVAAGQWKWRLDAVLYKWTTTDTTCIRQCWDSADSVFSANPNCYDLGGVGSGDKIQMDHVACGDSPFCGTSLCTGSLPDPVHIWVP